MLYYLLSKNLKADNLITNKAPYVGIIVLNLETRKIRLMEFK